MIRQAISCDICATEKKQTNHWFVASEQGGELRVSGWNSRNRMRPGMKHLCGQTCLHKLVDEFMARTLAVRAQQGIADDAPSIHDSLPPMQASASKAAWQSPTSDGPTLKEIESSARFITPRCASPARVRTASPLRSAACAGTGSMPLRRLPEEQPVPIDEPPRYASRNWRAEAWDRERERELRAVEHRPDLSPRRRAGS